MIYTIIISAIVLLNVGLMIFAYKKYKISKKD